MTNFNNKLFSIVKVIFAISFFSFMFLLLRRYDETFNLKFATTKEIVESAIIGSVCGVLFLFLIKKLFKG